MNTEPSFIIIDDSELDSFLTRKFLELTYKEVSISSFQNAQDVLDVIGENAAGDNLTQTIILLDLQMPLMNGFQFVEEFEKLPPDVQKNYKIVVQTVLTAKNDPNDIRSILKYDAVKSIMQKPLTTEKLLSLFEQLRSEA